MTSVYDEEPIFVPPYCCTKMDSSILVKMYHEAIKPAVDGGIEGKPPYVVTKNEWWPLGYGNIEPIRDNYAEGDWEFIVDPHGTYKVSLSDYGKTWIMYVGPDNEPFWNVMVEFQKCPPINVPDDPREDQHDKAVEFTPVETDELPF